MTIKSPALSIATLACVGLLSAWPTAQTPSNPVFEVASVKQNTSVAANPRISMLTDRLEAVAVPLRGLIALAYGEPGPPPQTRPNDRIVGGPKWIDTDMFDITAKTASDVPAGPAGVSQKLLMLRSLLQQRFKLAVHHEEREAAVYALMLARNDGRLGPRLHRSDIDCHALLMARGAAPVPPLAPGERPLCRAITTPPGRITAGALTMSDIANTLSRVTNQIVTDATGVTGAFDLDLEFSPEGVAGLGPPDANRVAAGDDRPSIFTALQEQLGLKLNSAKGTVDVLVIDYAEHPGPD